MARLFVRLAGGRQHPRRMLLLDLPPGSLLLLVLSRAARRKRSALLTNQWRQSSQRARKAKLTLIASTVARLFVRLAGWRLSAQLALLLTVPGWMLLLLVVLEAARRKRSAHQANQRRQPSQWYRLRGSPPSPPTAPLLVVFLPLGPRKGGGNAAQIPAALPERAVVKISRLPRPSRFRRQEHPQEGTLNGKTKIRQPTF